MSPVARLATCLVAALAAGALHAYPEGAPWGTANPEAAENCGTCHFDYDVMRDSIELSVRGFPPEPVSGETYTLTVIFRGSETRTAGFQVLATSEDGDAGSFTTEDGDMEIEDSGIRSTNPSINDYGNYWTFDWTAPERTGTDVVFYVAVMASNDDGSPFGDQAHFITVTVSL